MERFEALYWGELGLVEDPPVAEAMQRADAVILERQVIPYELVQDAVAYAQQEQVTSPA